MIKVEEHMQTCSEGKFKIFLFFQVKEDNKAISKTYEDHFIERFQQSI